MKSELKCTLEAMNRKRVFCQTRVCQVAWCSGRTPEDWQTEVIIPYTWASEGGQGAFLSLCISKFAILLKKI